MDWKIDANAAAIEAVGGRRKRQHMSWPFELLDRGCRDECARIMGDEFSQDFDR
jgi:hypothetical protein